MDDEYEETHRELQQVRQVQQVQSLPMQLCQDDGLLVLL